MNWFKILILLHILGFVVLRGDTVNVTDVFNRRVRVDDKWVRRGGEGTSHLPFSLYSNYLQDAILARVNNAKINSGLFELTANVVLASWLCCVPPAAPRPNINRL